jgi:hypothetical protein
MAVTPSPRVELYVRSLACRTGQQERLVETLHRLESCDAIDSLSVHVWGEAVSLSSPLGETQRAESILERVSAFRQWANTNGVSLDCAFQHAETDCAMTGQSETTLRLPTVAMAEYADGQLQHVTPHENDGVERVTDRVDTLAADVLVPADDQPRQSV